jgi:hypothetical protein
MPSKNIEVEKRPDGTPPDLNGRRIDTLESRYGNRFLLEPAPDKKLPKSGMVADLSHAPGETTGARTQGSSEAIMLGPKRVRRSR